MFLKTLTFQGQTRRFIVDALVASGWEVRVEQDSTVLRKSHYSDWHRVERAVEAIERETRELQAQGWRVTAAAGTVIR
jgi:hypothetical protein